MWVVKDLAMTKQIYIPLLDEGVNVWRPTQAEVMPDGSYRVLPTPDYDPEDEAWQFPPGSRVVCEPRAISAGNVLTAVRLVEAERRSA
jgi:hypothetical protein